MKEEALFILNGFVSRRFAPRRRIDGMVELRIEVSGESGDTYDVVYIAGDMEVDDVFASLAGGVRVLIHGVIRIERWEDRRTRRERKSMVLRAVKIDILFRNRVPNENESAVFHA